MHFTKNDMKALTIEQCKILEIIQSTLRVINHYDNGEDVDLTKLSFRLKEFEQELQGEYILIPIDAEMSDFHISAEYNPYCVWLHMKGRSTPIPIGNLIYPHRHDQLKIVGITNDYEGYWLRLNVIKSRDGGN
jgi:hypothetical protein